MIYASIETESARIELQSLIGQTEKAYIYRRLMVIQLSCEGKTVNELAAIFKLSPQTIWKFIHSYNQGGILQLMPQTKPGRRPRLRLTKQQWLDILHHPPLSFEKLVTKSHNWTLDLLVLYLKHYYEVSLSASRVWSILRQNRINMGRSQLRVTSPDPLYRQKRQTTQTLKKKRKVEI